LSPASFIDLLRRAGVNRPVFYSMLTRGAQGIAALVSIVLVARTLDRATQGYYFAILGFVTFIQLAEFGLTYAVMQSASHEAASGPHNLSGEANARLGSLLRGATRFNAGVTLLTTIVIAGVGTRMIRAGESSAVVDNPTWFAPWLFALLAVGVTQLLNPRTSLLEGAGFVGDVWRCRLIQEALAALLLWASLLLGWNVWAIAVSYATRALVGIVWLNATWRPEFFRALTQTAAPRDSYWWTEVWPFQWRIGVSALSGYLIFQFFTPLIFSIKGPTVAGQFGMTLALTNGLLTATTAWLSSQAPMFGSLIATRSYEDLDRAFMRSLRSSFLLVLIVALVLVATVALLDRLQLPIATRILPPRSFAMFAATTVVNHVIFAMAIYLRAHRREPLMISSVIGAIVTPLVVLVVGRRGGTDAIAASYLVMTVAGLAITTAIFVSRSRAWHADTIVPAR
jgi:O-antigen/teichoic acid export membrane protein